MTPPPPTGAPDLYVPLFTVSLQHPYYTRHGGLCADLRLAPTPATRALMRTLGLIFRDRGGWLGVYVQGAAAGRLAGALRRAAADAGGGFWTRLSFALIAADPRFTQVTSLPIALGGGRTALYASNRGPGGGDGAVLCAGATAGPGDLYPLVGSSLAFQAPPGWADAELADLSGAVVYPRPPTPPVGVVGGVASLDFQGLEDGLYRIRPGGTEEAPTPGAGLQTTVLHTPARADAVGLIDILLTQPTPDFPGRYPLGPLFDPGQSAAVLAGPDYALPFEARSTTWRYYVISQAPGTQLLDLAIQGAGGAFERQPDPPPLPNGAQAALFASRVPLPLSQTTDLRFQLTGARRDADAFLHPVRVASLPVAPASPVWPTGADGAGASEIYVYV